MEEQRARKMDQSPLDLSHAYVIESRPLLANMLKNNTSETMAAISPRLSGIYDEISVFAAAAGAMII